MSNSSKLKYIFYVIIVVFIGVLLVVFIRNKRRLSEMFVDKADDAYKDTITSIFKTYVYREPTSKELQKYREMMANPNDLNKVMLEIKNTKEYQQYQEDSKNSRPSSASDILSPLIPLQVDEYDDELIKKTIKRVPMDKKTKTYRTIIRIYDTTLNRMPTIEELNYYTARMISDDKLDSDQLQKLIEASREFQILKRNQSNQVYSELPMNATTAQIEYEVEEIYREVMGYQSSDKEFDYYDEDGKLVKQNWRGITVEEENGDGNSSDEDNMNESSLDSRKDNLMTVEQMQFFKQKYVEYELNKDKLKSLIILINQLDKVNMNIQTLIDFNDNKDAKTKKGEQEEYNQIRRNRDVVVDRNLSTIKGSDVETDAVVTDLDTDVPVDSDTDGSITEGFQDGKKNVPKKGGFGEFFKSNIMGIKSPDAIERPRKTKKKSKNGRKNKKTTKRKESKFLESFVDSDTDDASNLMDKEKAAIEKLRQERKEIMNQRVTNVINNRNNDTNTKELESEKQAILDSYFDRLDELYAKEGGENKDALKKEKDRLKKLTSQHLERMMKRKTSSLNSNVPLYEKQPKEEDTGRSDAKKRMDKLFDSWNDVQNRNIRDKYERKNEDAVSTSFNVTGNERKKLKDLTRQRFEEMKKRRYNGTNIIPAYEETQNITSDEEEDKTELDKLRYKKFELWNKLQNRKVRNNYEGKNIDSVDTSFEVTDDERENMKDLTRKRYQTMNDKRYYGTKPNEKVKNEKVKKLPTRIDTSTNVKNIPSMIEWGNTTIPKQESSVITNTLEQSSVDKIPNKNKKLLTPNEPLPAKRVDDVYTPLYDEKLPLIINSETSPPYVTENAIKLGDEYNIYDHSTAYKPKPKTYDTDPYKEIHKKTKELYDKRRNGLAYMQNERNLSELRSACARQNWYLNNPRNFPEYMME